MKNPRVSVVITCFNYARYLPEAVGSVVAQTYGDFEIIIVDDGSTDDTAEVAGKLIGAYGGHEVRLISQHNQGLSAARNAGIGEASGEYILPLDADDKIMPTYLEETVRLLDEDPDISIAYTDWQIFGEGVTEEQKALRIGREYDLETLLDNNFIHACNLYRRKAWEDVGGYKVEMREGYEDWEFWLSLAEAGHTGRYVDKRLYLYRNHGDSMVRGSNERREELLSRIRRMHARLYSFDAMDKIIVQRGEYIQSLEALARERYGTIERLYSELVYLRTGRGSLINAWNKFIKMATRRRTA